MADDRREALVRERLEGRVPPDDARISRRREAGFSREEQIGHGLPPDPGVEHVRESPRGGMTGRALGGVGLALRAVSGSNGAWRERVRPRRPPRREREGDAEQHERHHARRRSDLRMAHGSSLRPG